MTAQITLPRDAEGREISLDTKTLYDVNGKALDVLRWVFLPYADEGIRWRFECREFSKGCLPENFYLTPPDSWEQLLKDLDRAADTTGIIRCACSYLTGDVDTECGDCKSYKEGRWCTQTMTADVARRIGALRKENGNGD